MKTYIHRADTRGYSHNSWLKSYHTFSFDRYYDPGRMQFGALRVLNDDTVAPGAGFGTHPHSNMEIVSIPLKGALTHGDSHENVRTIVPGQIQTMSAGSGIYHSEFNASQEEEVQFLQIWVIPDTMNIKPVYQDYDIQPYLQENKLSLIVAPDGSAPARLHQDAWFSIGTVRENERIMYELHNPENGVYVFLIEGELQINDNTVLFERDGMGITDIHRVEIYTIRKSRILLMEIPLLEL